MIKENGRKILKRMELPCGHIVLFRKEFFPTIGEDIWCVQCGNYYTCVNGRDPITTDQLRIDNIVFS